MLKDFFNFLKIIPIIIAPDTNNRIDNPPRIETRVLSERDRRELLTINKMKKIVPLKNEAMKTNNNTPKSWTINDLSSTIVKIKQLLAFNHFRFGGGCGNPISVNHENR